MAVTNPEAVEAKGAARSVMLFVVLAGIGLIVLSHVPLSWSHWHATVREIAKEIGVTLFAVGTISLIYEWFIWEKHSKQFLAFLQAEIRKGEGNAAACAHLGIDEIYGQRWKFTSNYAIDDRMAGADSKTILRIFARSAHNLMSERVHVFNGALHAGAHVEICILDPAATDDELKLTQDVSRHDLNSAIVNLKHQLIPALQTPPSDDENAPKAGPPASGHLEVRYHRVPMLDSFLDIQSNDQRVCAWDLSFGRKVELKHIFRVDPSKPLGKHLLKRYAHVWDCSTVAYEWNHGKEITNNLA